MLLAIISAGLLGIYDILKKISLKNNPVLPVLFISTTTGALIFLPFVLISEFNPDMASQYFWYVPDVDVIAHILFLTKTIIVGLSWILAYYAIKNLPLTIATPIRSSGPLWTIIGAILIFNEKLSILQWTGIGITLLFYYIFSLSGKKEGIHFKNNKWVLFMTIATLIGSISSLFDKYLVEHYNRMAMISWYFIYMSPLMLLMLLLLRKTKATVLDSLQFRWSIPFIGICLAIADFVYFWALEDIPVAIVSTIRRAGVIISFTLGAILFKEQNIGYKAFALAGILAGIILIMNG